MLHRLHPNLLAVVVWRGHRARLETLGPVNLFFVVIIIVVNSPIKATIFVTKFAAACRRSIIAIFLKICIVAHHGGVIRRLLLLGGGVGKLLIGMLHGVILLLGGAVRRCPVRRLMPVHGRRMLLHGIRSLMLLHGEVIRRPLLLLCNGIRRPLMLLYDERRLLLLGDGI